MINSMKKEKQKQRYQKKKKIIIKTKKKKIAKKIYIYIYEKKNIINAKRVIKIINFFFLKKKCTIGYFF
jgi:hypothetical protein